MLRKQCSALLVDDEPLSLKLLTERIRKIPDIEIAACLPDGLSAREYLSEHPVDILLTDIRMPGIDGLELSEFVCQRRLACTVVIISGYSEFSYAQKAMKFGVSDYLLKPVQFTQMVEILEKLKKEIYANRNRLFATRTLQYQELEKDIIRSLKYGTPATDWSNTLNSLLTRPALLLRISHNFCSEESFFALYKNILHKLLPCAIILNVFQDTSGGMYLLIPQENHQLHSLSYLQGWFSHILHHETVLTIVDTIESADQLANLTSPSIATDQNKAIAVACEYMHSHLSEPLTREEVASKVYLSPPYFGHLFKKVMGIGYNEYLTDLRICQAKKLLTKNISIREIALAVSFRDAKYFSEIFHKKTGYMPSEYRRKLLIGDIKQEDSL